MTFVELQRSVGKKLWFRKMAFFLISLTTLREWYIRRTLARYLPDSKEFDFLDAGCGMGQHAVSVARTHPGARVTAVDVDAVQIEHCRDFARRTGLTNAAFHQTDLARWSAPAAYDVILCSSVLEHLDDDIGQLRIFYHSLRKGGILILYTPASERRVLQNLARTQQGMVRRTGDIHPHQHVRYYSAGRLQALVRKAGFEVRRAEITYGPYGRFAYDIVTTVQYSPLFRLIFPIYLLLAHPFVLILMWADVKKKNSDGNGVLLVARKAA